MLADGARPLLNHADALMAAVRSVGDEPVGMLRVGLPVGLPPAAMALVAANFRASFPRVVLNARFFDDPRRRLLDEVDLAVSIGDDPIEGPWATYEIGKVAEWLAASPEYLQRRGEPKSLSDLAEHDLFTLYVPGEDPGRLPLLEGGTYGVSPVASSTDPRMVQELSTAGHGIGLCAVPSLPGVDTRPLVKVLPGTVGRTRKLYLVVPRALIETPPLRAIFRFARTVLGREMVENAPAAGHT